MTVPMSAPSWFTTARAAGCGGTMAWTVIRAATTGTPILIKDIFACLAMLNMTGISSTKPTWKNTGMPQMKATTIIAQWALRSPKALIRVCARRWAPPEISSILPRMVPRPSTVARKPRVLPMPVWNDVATLSRGIPAAIPRARPAMVRATKALSLNFMIKRTMSAIATIRTLMR